MGGARPGGDPYSACQWRPIIREVFTYRRKLSWTLSIVVSLIVIGSAASMASPFLGYNGENAVSGAVTLFVIAPYWIWSYRRGRFPIIRIGAPARAEEAEFNAWRSVHHEAELAEFHAWKAAKAAERVNPEPTEPEPPPRPTIDAIY
jgi:hypothetical protein